MSDEKMQGSFKRLKAHRTKVVSVKLTNKEYFDLVQYSEKYGLPPSTVVYLLTKDALHSYDPERHIDIGFL